MLASPLEDVGAVEAPDRHAGSGYAVFLAEVGTLLPAVVSAGGRVIEEEEEFVEEGDGLAVGVLGVLEPVLERVEARDSGRSFGGFGFVGFGRRLRIKGNHKAAILRRAG